MAKDIKIVGNYIEIDRGDDLLDLDLAKVEIRKKLSSSEKYTIYYEGAYMHGYCDCLWSEFTLNGASFNNQQEFNDWKSVNTASGSSSGNGASLDDLLIELQSLNSSNNQINANISAIRTVNESIRDFVDGLESGQVITQDKLDILTTAVNDTSANEIAELQNIISFIDGLEAGQTVTEALLINISGYVDDLEALTQTLIDEVDQVEELLTQSIALFGNSPAGTVGSIRATSDGNVPPGAKVVSLVFRGNGGTLNGAVRPNGYAKEFFYPLGQDLPQIDYTVPTNGGGGAANRGIYIDVLT